MPPRHLFRDIESTDPVLASDIVESSSARLCWKARVDGASRPARVYGAMDQVAKKTTTMR